MMDGEQAVWTAEDELHRACDALAAAKLSEEEAAAVYAIRRLLPFGALVHSVAVSVELCGLVPYALIEHGCGAVLRSRLQTCVAAFRPQPRR